MHKIVLSLSIGFLLGSFIGFGLKTQQVYAQLDSIAENSEAKFMAAPAGGTNLGAPQGGSCG